MRGYRLQDASKPLALDESVVVPPPNQKHICIYVYFSNDSAFWATTIKYPCNSIGVYQCLAIFVHCFKNVRLVVHFVCFSSSGDIFLLLASYWFLSIDVFRCLHCSKKSFSTLLSCKLLFFGDLGYFFRHFLRSLFSGWMAMSGKEITTMPLCVANFCENADFWGI